MNDNEIRALAERLPTPAGLVGLQKLFGFTAAMRIPIRPSWSIAVRSTRSFARGTLRLHVIATRAGITEPDLRSLSRTAHDTEPMAHHILLVREAAGQRLIIASDAARTGVRHVEIHTARIQPIDLDVLRDLAAVPDEHGTAAALRIHAALCRTRLTDRFFRDVRGVRDAISRAWRGLPVTAASERDALALLLLSRVMFLHFLEQRNLLDDDRDFLLSSYRRWREQRLRRGTFFRAVLRILFFGVLNRRPEQRTPRARAFGDLPYLNGGLFERQRAERTRPRLDLDDAIIELIFEAILLKYRFTADAVTHDSAGGGIDPEMLGRIYEGLMPGDRRSTTGSFYTPAAVVDMVVTDVLVAYLSDRTAIAEDVVSRVLRAEQSDASDRELRTLADAAGHVRVLDPACGSGAFLIGTLARLELACAGPAVVPSGQQQRHSIVGSALHGVDLLEDAALICSLRLWLSLVPRHGDMQEVVPLPNLDRRIRQGDALVDPIDLDASGRGGTPLRILPLIRSLEPAAQAYLTADPQARPRLRRTLTAIERRIARAWLTSQRRYFDTTLRELRARSRDVDLFGNPSSHARAAHARLHSIDAQRASVESALADMKRGRALPFFSFRVHFAETPCFDVVLSNPPWVRAHNWPATLRAGLRRRFRVCADAGWPGAAARCGAGSQVDLAFLFLERSLALLHPRGVLGMVLPAKLMRSLAPGGARSLLMRDADLIAIRDYSLDQRAIFDADAFTAVVIARRRDPEETRQSVPDAVHVRMANGAATKLEFNVPICDLPLVAGDHRSPWLIAPPGARSAMRVMQRNGVTIRELGLGARRGAMTSANDVLIVRDVRPKLGDLAHVRADGFYRRAPGQSRAAFSAYIEASALRPILRGTDITPWRTIIERHVLWTPANDDAEARPGRRLAAYLRRHASSLGPANAGGRLQRLSAGMFGSKVVWSDLASDLRAAAVPALARTATGTSASVIPLNTVYFIPTACDRDALLLAALLNSLPLRTFARAIAERAKDAHFRFFAWTVSALPLPPRWRARPEAEILVEISRAAHADGAIADAQRERLDHVVAGMFGLDDDHMNALASFDAWLARQDAVQ